MNKPLASADFATPKVTTGPLPSSRKIHVAPEAAPDIRVPLREIILSEGAGEPNLPVYDTSGPYTDNDAVIDVEAGLKRVRADWVRERGGVEEYDGRPIKPVDNGNVSGKHLARNFPNTPRPMRAVETSNLSVPSPLVGEGQGGGSYSGKARTTPTPNPSPQGGGEHASASFNALQFGARTPQSPHPLTQLEWARAGVLTKEMIYVAARENLGRNVQL